MALQKLPLQIEEASNMVINYLKNNFNSYLEEVDHQYNDDINLEPVDDNAYFITEKIDSLSWPAIYLLWGTSAFQYDSDPNYLETEDSVIAVVSVNDIGADVLTRKVWRYGRILHGCLNQVDLITPDARMKLRILPERIVFTEPVIQSLPGREKTFRMDCVVELKIRKFENNLI